MKRKRKRAKKNTRQRNQKRPTGLSSEQLQQVARTTTGELFQPIRLHYAVSDPLQVKRTLLNLGCMDADPAQQRWVWLYTQEASRIPLQKAPETDPIVIGEFLLNGNEEVVLNVRSVERALAAVEFFDRHLPRSFAKLTHVTIINHLFSIADSMNISSLQALFEQKPLTEHDPDAMVARLLEMKEKSLNAHQQESAMAHFIEELTQQPEPEMEKFPAQYYEDGMASLRLKLRTQQAVAVKHWQGNTTYTSYNVIQDILRQSQE
ncbi:MAG: hypothetical protein GY801_00345 [bacterium]|nr:hypothetical protein [bacterium]